MKAISLWQPWASAMFPPVSLKRIETRSWPTSHRGMLAIHAAKKQSKELERFFDANNIDRVHGGTSPFGMITGSFYDLPFGAIIGFGNLVECFQINELNLNQMPQYRTLLNSNEQAWGNYDLGRFAWVFENLTRLDRPVPWRGAQGFFEVDITSDGSISVECEHAQPLATQKLAPDAVHGDSGHNFKLES